MSFFYADGNSGLPLWYRIMRWHNGEESVVLDFIPTGEMADEMAEQANLESGNPKT